MDILQTFQSGVEESAARLFTEYRDRLYAAALSQCGNDHAAAEDLVMATFEVYLTKKEMFDPSKGTLLSWLMTVMHNLRCNDIHRSKRSGVVYLNPEELNLLREIREFDNSTDAEILAKSDEEEIARILETLPPKVREAMHLRFFESMPVIQIAKVLAVSPGAIRVRIHYGRKILQKRLAKAAKKPVALVLALLLGLGAVFAAVKTGGFGLFPGEDLSTEERSGSAPIVKCMAATVDVGSGESAASVAGILDGDEVSTTMITGGTKMSTGKLAVAAVMASAMTINNADAATIRLSDFAVTETEVVSAKLVVTIETDEPCGLYAVYGHGDFCRTNLLDEAATSAVGREFDLANLAPGTDYSVYLCAQNPGDAVVRTEILSFSTGAEICGFPPSASELGKWSAAQYFPGQWRKVEGNVLAGLSTETSKGNAFQQEEQTTSKTGKELTDEIVRTTYDKSTMTAIHTDEILTWHLTEPADLQEVVLISRWSDKGRDGIDVNSVEVLTVDEPGTWRTVSSEAVSARDG